MKRKIIALMLALVFIVTALASCTKDFSDESSSDTSNTDFGYSDNSINNDNGKDDDKTSSTTKPNQQKETNKDSEKNDDVVVKPTENGGIEVQEKPDTALAPLVVTKSNVTAHKIVSFFGSNSDITSFANSLKAKTGANFTISTSTSSVGGRQIVIGTFGNLASYSGAPAFKSWTGAAVSVKDNTVFVGVADKTLLSGVLNSLLEKVTKIDDKSYGIAADLKFAVDNCAISEYVPLFTPTAGTNKGLYSSGGGNYQITYKNIAASDVSKYCAKLISSGYSLQQKNMINTNSFYLYVKGDTIVHINWFAKLSQFSIIYGPKTYLPAKSAVTGYTKKVTPSITQLALGETGLSLVLQLEDGSFVVIDGGKGGSSCFDKDSKTLINFLTSKAPNGEKPRVTWIVTHIHTDHRQLMQNFLPSIKDKIKLELVAWNLPDFSTLSKYTPNWKESYPPENYLKSMDLVNNALKNSFPNVPIYTFHTGEKLYLPGCEIEFLATHEDYYLNNFIWINDTSSAFRVTMQGKTMMVFGDCTADVNNKIMTAAFGNYIKSDIMQVTHHGVGGGTLATFKAVDPDICLWSLNKDKFDDDERALGTNSTANSCNIWLRASSGSDGQRARKHYHHSYTTTITIPTMSVSQTKVYTDR